MISWFAKNSVAANLLMVTIVAAGLYSVSRFIPLEIFPSFATDYIAISIDLPGATPEDAENGISVRVEEAIQDLEGIKRMTSVASEGNAYTSIEVTQGYDARALLSDVKARVDAINTLPEDADQPVIALAVRKRDVITVSIASIYGEKETNEFAQTVRDELLRLPDVTQVQLEGVRNHEISISVPQQKLRQYNLTIAEISEAIQQSSLDLSSGNLNTDGGDILLRSQGQAYRKDDFSTIVVKTEIDGSTLYLGDIALINDGFEETPVQSRFNGKKAVFFKIYRVGEQSALEVSEQVRSYIEDKQATLPQGFELSYWDDDARIVKGRLSTLGQSAIQGSVLVLLLLSLFLRPTIAFWVFIGIPVSFMGAFFVMPLFGITLNVLSLFAFILVLGIVVDDAIVTGESVYRRLDTAPNGEVAAIEGTKEVARPVTFGVLTTVASFIPLLFIQGDRSPLFTQIPYVVIPILLFSLIETKFILPAHLKHLKLRKSKKNLSAFEKFQHRFADGFEQLILTYYRPALRAAIKNKLTTLSIFFAVFGIILSLVFSGWTKFTFFPDIPAESVEVSLTMPTGTPFEVTDRHVVYIASKAEELRQKYTDPDTGISVIKNILVTTGSIGGASHEGELEFETLPPDERTIDITTDQLADEWRRMVGPIPGAERLAFSAELGPNDDPIEIQISGNSLENLSAFSEIVKARLATYPTLHGVSDTLSDGKEELKIELTEQGKALGLSRFNVAHQVRQAFYGLEAQSIQRGRNDIKVMVRLPREERRSLASLENLTIHAPNGSSLPLSQVATLTPSKGPSSITRVNRYRAVTVTADYEKENTNMIALETDLTAYLNSVISQYPGVSYSLEGDAREQKESISSLLFGLGFVVFIIYGLLAIPFKSYLQPIVVMSIIPFGTLGAIVGHWIMGMPLTIFSLLGMLALIGVVINDSLVLVDYINKKRQEGENLMHAVLTAGTARFRPVILTSLTTFIGLMPLLFETSTQAQMLIPMAVSLGFGILFATFITLLLIPVNYLLLEEAKTAVSRFFTPKMNVDQTAIQGE